MSNEREFNEIDNPEKKNVVAKIGIEIELNEKGTVEKKADVFFEGMQLNNTTDLQAALTSKTAELKELEEKLKQQERLLRNQQAEEQERIKKLELLVVNHPKDSEKSQDQIEDKELKSKETNIFKEATEPVYTVTATEPSKKEIDIDLNSCETLDIAVVSINSGGGATHIALTIANALGGNRGNNRVAICDLAARKSFNEIAKTIGIKNQPRFFKLRGVDYFSGLTYEGFIDKTRGIYDYVIIDFGAYVDLYDLDDYLNSSLKITVASGADWRLGELVSYVNSMEAYSQEGEWKYVVNFCTQKNLQDIRKLIGIKSMQSFPYVENPFEPSKEDCRFVVELLETIAKSKQLSRFFYKKKK